MVTLSILALVASLAALITAYLPWKWSVGLGALAMILAWLGALALPAGAVPFTPLILWGVSALIVVGLNLLLPSDVVKSKQGVGYLCTGALVGAVLGWIIGQNWISLGAVIGCLLAAFAFVRTPSGNHLDYLSAPFVQWLCAKGFPAVVTVSMAVIAIYWSVASM